ncbi:MAG: MFS transporter [Patulibacter sp.]|nr:MFS transporter [Patulibacter sp.]
MTVEPPRQHANVTLAALALAGMAFSLLQSMVSPALHEIQTELGTSETAVAWLLTGYLLSAAVSTPIVGRLGDMFGKARVLRIVLVILCLGTVMAAMASSIGVLIAARLIQGVAGGVFPLAFGIIRDEFPREKVAGSIGLISALLGIGGGFGVVLAGVIVDNLSYHWLFWLPLIAVVAATVLVVFFVPESPIKAPGKVNWSGAILMSLGLSGLLLAISQAASWGWGSARTLAVLAVGVGLLAAWVRNEQRAVEPLVDMRMMRIRGVWTTNVVALLTGVGMYSSFVLTPLLVQLPVETGFGFGVSVTAAGVYILPSALTMLLAGSMVGRLEARFGSKPPLMVGSVFTALSFALLAVAHSEPYQIYLASLLQGVGIGLAFASMANLIVQNVRPDQTGVATGMNTVARSVGGALGAQIVAAILTASVVLQHPTETAFTIAFVFGAAMMAAAVAVSVLIPGRSATVGG